MFGAVVLEFICSGHRDHRGVAGAITSVYKQAPLPQFRTLQNFANFITKVQSLPSRALCLATEHCLPLERISVSIVFNAQIANVSWLVVRMRGMHIALVLRRLSRIGATQHWVRRAPTRAFASATHEKQKPPQSVSSIVWVSVFAAFGVGIVAGRSILSPTPAQELRLVQYADHKGMHKVRGRHLPGSPFVCVLKLPSPRPHGR